MSQRQRRAKQGKSNGRKLSSAIIIASIVFLVGGLVWYYFYTQRERSDMVTPQVSLPAPVMTINKDGFTDEGFESSLEYAVEAVEPLAEDPYLGSSVEEVLAALPEIESLLENMKVQQTDLIVDVILQNHGGKVNSTEDVRKTQYSQQRVYRLLEVGNYDVVGNEGSYLSRVSYQGLREAFRKDNPQETQEGIEARITRLLERIASTRYAINNPSVHVIGCEHDILNKLFVEIGDEYEERIRLGSPPRSRLRLSDFMPIFIKLGQLRSEVAVAKVLRELKLVGGKRGAIVIGRRHHERLVDILRHLHIRSAIYDTTKE